MVEGSRLSPEAVVVLQLISAGWSYAQIIDMHPELSYFDIFGAAQEALDINRVAAAGPAQNAGDSRRATPIFDERLADIKAQSPRAYEAWTDDEVETLEAMFTAGATREQIAERLQRQPSAIASRIRRLFPGEALGRK